METCSNHKLSNPFRYYAVAYRSPLGLYKMRWGAAILVRLQLFSSFNLLYIIQSIPAD